MRRIVPVLTLGLLSLCGCDFVMKIDASKAEGLVETILKKEGVTADSISCPKDQSAKAGTKFECTAEVAGVAVHFALEVMDDKGTVVATPRDHTILVAKMEPEIAEDLKAKGHSVKSIDCHGDVWVAVKDAVVKCDVIDEAGKEYVWTAKFINNDGKHEHSIKPKA